MRVGALFLAASVTLASTSMAYADYKRLNVLNALYSGSTQPILPRNKSEEEQMTAYFVGFIEVMTKKCSITNGDVNGVFAAISLMGILGGGVGFIAGAGEGESDANKLLTDYGCQSKQVQTIMANLNSFVWIK